MHSTTYRRQAKKIQASIALDQRIKESAQSSDHYTEEDRKVAEDFEASELWREFLATEMD